MSKTISSTTYAFRKGDTVLVLAGDDKGKQAKIIQMLPKASAALVDGVNMVTRHVKPTRVAPQGGRIEKPAKIHTSNLQLICPNCSKPTKVDVKITGANREKTCHLCHESLVRKEQA